MSLDESIEIKKQEFLNYLEQHGILDKITDVFTMLFNEPEQPLDVVDYVRRNICADNPDVKEIAKMTALIEKARLKLAELQSVRDEIKAKLEQFETLEGDMAGETEENGEVRLLEDNDDDKQADTAAERFSTA